MSRVWTRPLGTTEKKPGRGRATDMVNTGRIVNNGIGTPILIQARNRGKGVMLSQGSSYLIVGLDEIEMIIAAMREVADSSR
jgi:hypothetical protein